MSQESNAWIIDQMIACEDILAMLPYGQEHVFRPKIYNIFTTNDMSSTRVTMTLNGIELFSDEISNADTDPLNPLPYMFMIALNAGVNNFPTTGYWADFLPLTQDLGTHMSIQLPSHTVMILKHSFPISAVMEPSDGMTNHVNPTYPQYPDIIVTGANGVDYTLTLDYPYDENPTVTQEAADYYTKEITDEIIIAEPEERPPLLENRVALVVLRSESELPNTTNSQGGDKEETIYIEIRGWTKQTVHDLKELIQDCLEDLSGVLPSGGSVHRVRHDWNRSPYKNANGVTWESQIRYVVWYR